MHLTRIECRAFRCLGALALTPVPGLNLLRAGNAQGKTSVLEAVLFATTSKSHRTSVEEDLAAHGSDSFQLCVAAERSQGPVQIEANWWRGTKRFKVNGVPQTRISDVLGRINVVLFCPEDIGLVKGSAASRRRFLDMELSQIQPQYLGALQQYRQVLRQRNEVLRSPRPDAALVAPWDAQLAAHGQSLMRIRREFVAALSNHASAAYAHIAEDEPLTLAYRPDIRDNEEIEAVLGKSLQNDIRRGLTHRGPHRDDVEILIDGRPARTFGSQGQQKTAALALKLAELKLIHAHTGEYPVLMLDEVLAELDAARARRLLTAVGEQVQCIMTTTELEDVRDEVFGRPAANFVIESGDIRHA